MRALLVVFGLLLCGGTLPLAAAPTAPEAVLQRERQVSAALLSREPKLERKVTLAWKSRPVGAAVVELGKTLGVSLSASADAADDKITAFLDQRPAAEALSLVAEELRFQWLRRGSGYQLSQSETSKREEARLRDDERADQWASLQAQIARINRVTVLSDEQRRSRAQDLITALRRPEITPADRAQLLEEQQAVTALNLPAAAVALRIYQALTPAQMALVRAGGNIRYSTFDGTLAPELAVEIARTVGNRGGFPKPPDPKEQQVDVIVQLTDERGVQTNPETADQTPLRLNVHLPVGTSKAYFPMQWGIGTPLATKGPVPDTVTEDAALKRPVTLPPAPVRRDPGGFTGASWPEDLPTVADVAEALHRDAGLEVVAEGFIRGRLRTPAAGPVPAIKLLDTLSNRLAYSWRQEGNLIRVRDEIYYRDRPLEVPERVLAAWNKQVGERTTPSLEDLSTLAAALTDSQARGLYEFWGWYFEKKPFAGTEMAFGFNRSLPELRLWAQLAPAQRAAALAGTPLPATRFSVPQKQLYLRALQDTERQPGPMRSQPIRDLGELQNAVLQVNQEEQRHQKLRMRYGNISSIIDQVTRLDGSYVAGSSNPQAAERIGDPYTATEYTFTYALPDRDQPLRRNRLSVPQAPQKAGGG